VLLGTVVQVALDRPPGLVRRGDDAQPGGPQLGVALLQLLQRRLQRRVEADVVQSEPELTGELHELALLLVGVVVVVDRTPHDDQAEQLPEVRHRRDPQLPRLHQAGEPDGAPAGPADPGPADDDPLALRQGDPFGRPGGHADRAGEDAVRPDPDLGPGGRDRRAQRLGELQHELVHGDGSAHPRPERGQRLFRGHVLPPDQPGRQGQQALPHGQHEDRHHHRRDDARDEHLALAPDGHAVEPDDHHEVDDHHEARDAGDDDRLDERRLPRVGRRGRQGEGLRDGDEDEGRDQPRSERVGHSDQHV
jgi:hypothetical protein